MVRPARILLPSTPLHLVQRGNNRGACFVYRSDARRYLAFLDEARQEYQVDVHAYVLMSNHVHLLATPRDDPHGISQMMKSLGQRYAQYFNRRHERTGGLFEGRYCGCLVGEEAYLFACYRYIELNPVRAGMVEQPGDYLWSSYRANALGAPDPVISPHTLYLASASDPAQRQHHYRHLFDSPLPEDTVEAIRQQTRRGHPLTASGSDP